ncbi:unnamed protein product [Somion occarium]|uniref:Uncharacterized protein n=1 Tax=Somion occarium TaxID=3059160 RepID=A0ABP1DFZ7_9APHY
MATQTSPSLAGFDAFMVKDIGAPTWEDCNASSVGGATTSDEQFPTDKRHSPHYWTYTPPKESSRFAFAQKPVRRTTANDIFQWPPPSSSPPFRFDPFGDSEEPTTTPIHFTLAPVRKSPYTPLALYDTGNTISLPAMPLWLADDPSLANETVEWPSPMAQPQTSQKEPLLTERPTPFCPLAHSATLVVSQSSVATAPSLYEDKDDFVLRALRLPWLEDGFIDGDELTSPSTPLSTPLLSPLTLADDDEDLPILEKGVELRGFEEPSPLARDRLYLTGW